MEKRKDLEIPVELMEPEWKSNKVVVKMLTFGETLKIRDGSIDLKVNNRGIQKLDLYTEAAEVSKVVTSVVEAPWQTGDKGVVAGFNGVFGQWLSSEIDAFNTISLTEKKNKALDTRSTQGEVKT